MRITKNQLRKIVMEEVVAAKRAKRIQEARAKRRKMIEARARRSNMNEMYHNVLNPRIGLAGAILVGMITALGLASSFSSRAQETRAEIESLASEACEIAAQAGDTSCSPDQALEQAHKHVAATSGSGMSVEPIESYGEPDLSDDF